MLLTEQITANISGPLRRAKLGGREHIVVPVTLIVPGVLNGSQGPLYYPPEELRKNPAAWNHIPIVVYHPIDNGMPRSARDPDILNSSGVGVVLRANMNGKLTAEAWFDVENTRRIDSRILDALEQGKKIEISTGLGTRQEPVDGEATHNGKPYIAVARDHQPDHLAILPDQVGACSVEDGCGVNNKETPVSSEDQDMKLNEKQRKEIVDNLITNVCCWEEEDREILNKFSDEKLTKLRDESKKQQEQEAVANAVKEGFNDQQGNSHVFNAESGKWESKFKEPENKEAANKNQETTNVNNTENKNNGKETDKPKTEEEWLASAPESVRNTLAHARGLEQREKEQLVGRLTANIKDDKIRKAQQERLMKRPLEDLQADVELLPEDTEQTQNDQPPLYVGASPAHNVSSKPSDFDEDDVLPRITVNDFDEKGIKKEAAASA